MSLAQSTQTISDALAVLKPYDKINKLLNDNNYNEADYDKFDKLKVLQVCKHKLYYSVNNTSEFIKFYLDMFIFYNNKAIWIDKLGFGDNKYRIIKYENNNGEIIATLHKFWNERIIAQNNKCYTKDGRNESYIQIEQKNINKINPDIIDKLEAPIYNFGQELKTIFENDNSDGLIDYLNKYPSLAHRRFCYENISCDLTLLNISEIFGAVRCFKYLMLTYGYDINESNSICSVIGGNYEIFHICEQQNDINYEVAIKHAIRYHRNGIAERACRLGKIKLEDIIKLCLENYNYEVLNIVNNIITLS